MNVTDRARLEGDARHILDVYEERSPAAARVARVVLAALENPAVFVPEGYALVKKPELLGKGVPGSDYKP